MLVASSSLKVGRQAKSGIEIQEMSNTIVVDSENSGWLTF